MKILDIIVESANMASAEQIWDYVGGIHPKDQQGGGFLKRLIMRNPQYELKRVPLSSLHVPNDEDEGNDPYGRAMFVDVDHAREYSQHHVDKKPVVADAEGHILDGAHRAWAAAELLNKTDIMAWVPAKKLTEGQSVKQEIEEFLDSLTPDDVGVEEFPGYRVHFEGFTDDCKSSGDYRRNPDAVYQQVYQDFVDREHGRTPIESNMVGDEEYPILYSIFRVKQGVAEGKVKLHTDPGYFGAEVDDAGFDSLPIVNIPANKLVGFEPDSKMNQTKSQANVEKIVAGLKKGDKLPPLLVRKYKNGYQVLDGHHRFWAYKLSGTKSIPVRIVADKDIEEIGKQDVAKRSQQ